jgi:glycosyltransferase involved in cell wall biosynthesis
MEILSDQFKSKKICIVIPMYKVEPYIKDVIMGIPTWIWKIILIDDASPDHSSEVVSSVNDPRVEIIRLESNQGVGGAVLTGYKKAVELGANIIVKMDSDGQMDPAYLIPLIAPILTNRADYAKGNRFLHANELKSMPLIRRIGNAGLSFLTKSASGYWNIFDPTNGYTAISAKIIPLLNTDRISRRFFFETSLLIELGLLRAVVEDVGIPAIYGDEKSHLSEWKTFFEFPPKLVKGFIRRIIFNYFIRDFTAFSLLFISGVFGILFGSYWGIDFWVRSAITGMIASTGTVMIAVLPIILGVQFLLQAMVMDVENVPTQPLSNNGDILL